MLDLNLLPPKEKINLRYGMRTRAVLAVGGILASAFIASISLLAPTLFALFFQKSELLQAVDVAAETSLRAGVPKNIGDLNAAKRLAKSALTNDAKSDLASGLLRAVFADVPNGIRLESLKVNLESNDINIGGFSPDRQTLLAFLSNLKNNPSIASVSSPVANIIKETDISFSVSAKVNPVRTGASQPAGESIAPRSVTFVSIADLLSPRGEAKGRQSFSAAEGEPRQRREANWDQPRSNGVNAKK